MAAGACCLAILTGCPWDDDDDDVLDFDLYGWVFTFTEASGEGPDSLELTLPWEDTSELDDLSGSYGGYDVDVERSGDSVDIFIVREDGSTLDIVGATVGPASVNGDYEIEDKVGTPSEFYTGTFVLQRD
jgi:hypothetical protein